MEKETRTLQKLKQEVGERFKSFRIHKKKSQKVLATELGVHQSTITNIEKGEAFPKVNYLNYLYEEYGLNLNWLVTGKGSHYMDWAKHRETYRIMASTQNEHEREDLGKIRELNALMKIPVIRQQILARLGECKVIFRNQVDEYIAEQEKKMAV